jgi:hypothetical protein
MNLMLAEQSERRQGGKYQEEYWSVITPTVIQELIHRGPDQRVGFGKDLSPALDPVFSVGVAQGLPPVVSGRDKRFFACDSERKTDLPVGRGQFGNGLAVAGDDYGLPFLNQFQEPGKPGLGLVYVNLH